MCGTYWAQPEIAFPEKLGKTRSGKIIRRRKALRSWGETWEICRRSRSRAVVQQPGKNAMYKGVAVCIIHDGLGTGGRADFNGWRRHYVRRHWPGTAEYEDVSAVSDRRNAGGDCDELGRVFHDGRPSALSPVRVGERPGRRLDEGGSPILRGPAVVFFWAAVQRTSMCND